MIDNSYHRRIVATSNAIDKNQNRGRLEPEDLEANAPVSANMYATAYKNMTLKKLGGGNSQMENDAHRVEMENAMGSGKTTTGYKRQMPKLSAGGIPNMEMEDERETIKRGSGKIPPNTFGRIQQAVLEGGNKKVKADLVDVILNKLMSPKSKKESMELEVDEKLGAGWTHAIKEMEGGRKPKPAKKDIILGRGTPETQMQGSGGGDRRKMRAECIKRIMKEKGMKMIEASKYIKSENIKY